MNKPFSKDEWMLRKALLSTIQQAWYQVDAALHGIANAERAQVSSAIRSLEAAIFKAELDSAKESVGCDRSVSDKATNP